MKARPEMRNIAKKKANDARRHAERMANDLEYRCRRLLNCVRARCLSGKGRNDWEWYGGKNLEVTVAVQDIMATWQRDGATQMTRPDLDRKESHIGYTPDNIQFIEHADNLRKMIATRRKRRWHRKPSDPTTEVA